MLHVLAVLAAAAAAPMSQQSSAPPAQLPGADDSDDIIVSALRIPRDELPTGVYWDYPIMFDTRVARERATLFMRCALKASDAATIRKVVDGEVNSAPARFAQGLMVQRGAACQPGLPQRAGFTNQAQTTIDYGNGRLDRGIIVDMVLRDFAPDAALTTTDTADPAVRSRHQLRELARNRRRLPNDWAAWSVTSCLVREQPVLATRLVRAKAGSMLERGLLQAMLVDGRSCLGQVKRMTIDPANFRTYVVDSYYRWLVAARNVASLVPDAAMLPPRKSGG